MASNTTTSTPDSIKFSISCFDVPDELLEKSTAKSYFQRFGKLLRVRIRTKQKYCTAEYLNEESAARALAESGDFNGIPFKVCWTKHKSKEKKKVRKKSSKEWPVDSEIQAELEAMRGSFTTKREDSPKKSSLKKVTPRQWKSEKPKAEITSLNSEQDSELLKIIMNFASTNEDKFRILDARDKLIRSRIVRQSELSRAIKTIGTCPDMCPEKERLMREVQHQVATYEQLEGHKGSMNHNLAVKQYSRSSADQETPLPHELRPVQVLLFTMGYLLHKIMDLCENSDVNLAEWYHFVWDRTRGIRKDVTQQELCCLDSVKLVEQCARFHVFCAAWLVGEDVSVFDDKINTENLTKCLQTLKYMYHDLRVKNIECPNEAEFRAYVVLLNLNDGNFMWEVQQLDEKIQQSPEIKFAIQVYSALDKNNYVRFFKLVQNTTYLNSCVLLRYFNQVRFKALLTILKCFSPRQPNMQYPIAEICRILAFEDVENTVEFLEYYGLTLNSEKTHVVLNRKNFQQPDMPFVLERAKNIIESKRECSVGEIVCGMPLPAIDFEKHIPHNSFNEKGLLKLLELPKEFHVRYQEFLDKNMINQNLRDDLDYKSVEEHLSDEEKPPVNQDKQIFSFQEKFNENSKSEIDGAALYPNFIPSIPAENRSQSPLTVNKATDNNFWSKPPQNTFSFTSNFTPKKIFGNETKALKIEEVVPKAENEIKSNEKSYVPIPSISFTNPIKPIANPKSFGAFKPISVPDKTFEINLEELKKQEERRKQLEEQEMLEKYVKEQELLKIRREEQELEERRRREHIEELKIQEKINFERKRIQTEQEKIKQQALLEAKMKSDVNILLQNILNQVEQQLVKDRLKEISENIKKRRALQFLKRWRNLTKISRKKRKNFFDNPVWVGSKSAKSEAEELYTPSQNLTLHDAKRYKRGVPSEIKISDQRSAQAIDVYKIVYKILFEKLCTEENCLNLNLFWKIGISFCDEDGMKLDSLFDTIKDIFSWQKIDTKYYVTKRCFSNNGGSLTYCIKELSQVDKFWNGLFFIILGDISHSYKKLIKIVKSSFPAPLVVLLDKVINKNLVIKNLKLQNLLEKKYITSYEILFYSNNNLELTLSSGLEFLAKNVNSKPNLNMDALPAFLRNCIGEEFWLRIYSSCQINERLAVLLREPNTAIDLYNEALKRSLGVIFDPDLLKQPTFPIEFKPYVKQQQVFLPCSYEYFPDYWNSKSYLNKVEKSVAMLFLPKFTFTWPPKDQCDLQEILERYCEQIFKDSDCIVLKLLSFLLDKIDLNFDFTNQMRSVSWSSVIQIITLEKMKHCQFFDKTHAVYTVVYNSDNLKDLRNIPWWYNTDIIKDKIKLVQIEETFEPEVVIDESEEEISIDKTFEELQEDPNAEERSNLKHEFDNLNYLLADLEESMRIQKKIMNRFQEKVNSTFNFK